MALGNENSGDPMFYPANISGAAPGPTPGKTFTLSGAPPVMYTQAELDAAVVQAIDRDRVKAFMLFARKNMTYSGLVTMDTTPCELGSVFRALEKAGY